MVLRHELAVMRRQLSRPTVRLSDRASLAAASGLLRLAQLALVLRDAAHAAGVAPSARRRSLDASGAAPRPPAGEPRGPRAGVALIRGALWSLRWPHREADPLDACPSCRLGRRTDGFRPPIARQRVGRADPRRPARATLHWPDGLSGSIRSRSSKSRQQTACRSSCRSVTDACRLRRLPSIGARPM